MCDIVSVLVRQCKVEAELHKICGIFFFNGVHPVLSWHFSITKCYLWQQYA